MLLCWDLRAVRFIRLCVCLIIFGGDSVFAPSTRAITYHPHLSCDTDEKIA